MRVSDWPGAKQVLQRTVRIVHLKSGKASEAVTYGITNLSAAEMGPQGLEGLWREHWTMANRRLAQNRSHYVRDESLGEDRCRPTQLAQHVGDGPQGLAALRNGLLSVLRYQGWENIPAAFRYLGASVQSALTFIGALAI